MFGVLGGLLKPLRANDMIVCMRAETSVGCVFQADGEKKRTQVICNDGVRAFLRTAVLQPCFAHFFFFFQVQMTMMEDRGSLPPRLLA